MTKPTGVIPALITPFGPDGAVDYTALERLVQFHLQSGVGGLYVTGSTGEWIKLTLEERKKIVETVAKIVKKTVPVIAHIGHDHTDKALELCEHAAVTGVDLVAAVVPGYYNYGIKEVSAHYRRIAEVGLPVIVYYLKGNSTFFAPEVFVEEIGSIDGVVGLKYTAADLFAMQTIQSLLKGRLDVWCGYDQMALPGLLMNAIGIIGSSYNYIPEIFVELYKAYIDGNLKLAQALQIEANSISYAVKRFGDLPAYRAVLKMRGLDVGDSRPPALALGSHELPELRKAITPHASRLPKIESTEDDLLLVH